jgi:hypothetical protein
MAPRRCSPSTARSRSSPKAMDIVIRAAVAFLFIFMLTRIVGRRELGTLEPFDLILLVLLGDLVQQGITQSDYSVTGLILAAGTIALLTVLTSYLSFRFKRLRPLLDGEPMSSSRTASQSSKTFAASGSRSRRFRPKRDSSRSPHSTMSSGQLWRRAARSASSRSKAEPPGCSFPNELKSASGRLPAPERRPARPDQPPLHHCLLPLSKGAAEGRGPSCHRL